MSKSKQIGGLSLSHEAYEKFVSLDKSEQVRQVAETLSPISERRATKLLTHVPHGDIGSGNDKKAEKVDTTDGRASAEDNNARPESAEGKSKRVQKGRKS